MILAVTSTRALSLQTTYPIVDDLDLILGKAQQAIDDSLKNATTSTLPAEAMQLANSSKQEGDEAASLH